MAKKKEKKEEKQPEITSEQIIENMKGDYTNLLTYAQSLEKTVQDLRKKIEVYEDPYMSICAELFECKDAYEKLKQQGVIEFLPTQIINLE